jgi:hypothetical protein
VNNWGFNFGGFTDGVTSWRSVPLQNFGFTYDTWHTLKLTWDGVDEIAGFLNGVSFGTQTMTAPTGPFDTLRIGLRGNNIEPWPGRMSDFKFTQDGTLIFHYKMDDNNPTIAYDSSGNGNDGTKTNITASTFHYEGNDVPYSWQNEVGYTDAAWSGTAGASLGTGWSNDTGTGTLTATAATAFNKATINLTGYVLNAETYRVRFELTHSAGTCNVYLGNDGSASALIGSYTSSQSIDTTHELPAGESLQILFRSNNGATPLTATIDSIQVDPIAASSIADRIPRDESDTANDVLGNTLQYTGEVPHDGKLINSHCATFDGVDDEIASNTTLSATVNVTIAMWVKAPATGSAWGIFARKAAGNYWLIQRSSTGAAMQIQSSTSAGVVSRTISDFFDDTWKHLIIVWDSAGGLKSYINGVLELDSTYDEGTGFTTDAGIQLGSFGGFAWGGSMAGFQYWGSDQSANALAIYNGSDLSPDLGYALSEGAGIVAYDISGNGNHGTAANITESTFWGTTQDVFHHNITKGFDFVGRLDGTNDYIDYGIIDFDWGTNDFTIEATCEIPATNDVLFGAWESSVNNRQILIQAISGAPQLTVSSNGTATSSLLPSGTFNTGDIVKLRIERVSGTITYYVDGTSRGTLSAATIKGGNVRFIFGSYAISPTVVNTAATWTGQVSDLKITVDGSTIIDCPISEGSGTTITDNSGNSNDGTATNVTVADFWAIRVPGASDGTSILRTTISNPAVAIHNNAETQIDFTGGVSTAPWTQQVYRGYAEFDGTDDYISFSSINSQLSKASDHNGSITIKLDDTSTNQVILGSAVATDDRFYIGINSNSIRLTAYDGSTFANVSETLTDTSNFHTITWSYDSSGHTLTATLDGVAMTGSVGPSTASTVGTRLGTSVANTLPFNGQVRDFSITYGS